MAEDSTKMSEDSTRTSADLVTQTNLQVVAASPAVAMGNLYLATSAALARAAQDAVTAQQTANISANQAANAIMAALFESHQRRASGLG